MVNIPTHAVAGQTLYVSGTGFLRGEILLLAWDGVAAGKTVRVDGAGSFAIALEVPARARPGVSRLELIRGSPGHGASHILATASVIILERGFAAADPRALQLREASGPGESSPADEEPLPTSLDEVALMPASAAIAPSPSSSLTTVSTSTPSPEPIPTLSAVPTPSPPLSPLPSQTVKPPNSGEPMPTGNLPGWKLIFADDFTQDVPLGQFPAAVSDRWFSYPYPWRDTSGNGVYWPEKVVSIHDGVMDLWLRTENGQHLVSAPQPRLPGSPGGNQLYGRYAVRFRADPVPGYKAAWLLWPQSEVWPRDGEIDYPDGNLDGHIEAFMHRQDGTSGSDQDWYKTGVTFRDWHTAIIEWSPAAVTFILDGRVIGRSTARIPNTAMRWVLQTETALSSTPPATSAQGHVYIDWVVIWSYAP
jgi:hypothetical protein